MLKKIELRAREKIAMKTTKQEEPKKKASTIGWAIKKLLIGSIALMVFNIIGSLISIDLPFNYISAFLIGSLGFPGFVLVYVTHILFLF